MISAERIREDFDRLARLTADDGERPGPYDAFLLRQIPASARSVLEVGCGTGAFSRALAARGHRVTAIDLSPEMIRVARERTPPELPVAYRCGDLLGLALDDHDAVVSIATLHHLPMDVAIERMAGCLRPGGVLAIHDLRADRGLGDRLRLPLAAGARAWDRLRAGRLRARQAVREAWAEHGRGEHYLTMPEVEACCRERLPGARAFRHLQWRYTIVWTRPASRPPSPIL